MANRYITALLIILAATGVEAQNYESALKLALSDISYQEFIQQPEVRALEDDILSVFKAFKQTDNEKDDILYPFCILSIADTVSDENTSNADYSTFKSDDNRMSDVLRHSIVIRGPNS